MLTSVRSCNILDKVKRECDEFEMDVLINKIKIIQSSNTGNITTISVGLSPPIHNKQGDILDEFLQWCMNRNIIPDINIDHDGTGNLSIIVNSEKQLQEV